jgi:steroid 5-alpha reductase family enzyme
VEPQEPSTRVPGVLVAVVALLLGIAWLVIFAVRLVNGDGANWFDTWWPLLTGFAFVLLAVDRLRTGLHSR